MLAHDEAHDVSPPPMVSKRRPGPIHPKYSLPAEHWPTVIHRVVEQKEPLRTVAAAYGVSPETIRRLLHIHQQRGQQEVYGLPSSSRCYPGHIVAYQAISFSIDEHMRRFSGSSYYDI